MVDHKTRVARIAEAIGPQLKRGGFASLKKSGISHLVPNPHNIRHKDVKIDIQDLNHILSIDPEANRCITESGVPFSELIHQTLAYKRLPKLVPELKTVTVGGAVAGGSVESMSFKYGGFHDSCLEYELITGTGDIITCSREHNSFIFDMIHASYGTLGILTKLEFELIPAEKFVRVDYEHCPSITKFEQLLLSRSEDKSVDFFDGIIHSPNDFVACTARFIESAPWTSDYTHNHIYYKSTRNRRYDYLTTYDYVFRYDTECHWLTRKIPGLENRMVRNLLGRPFLGSTNLISWTNRLGPVLKRLPKRPPVIIDTLIPYHKFVEFYHWYHEVIHHYPIWVVLYRVPAPYPWLNPSYVSQMSTDLFIDFGIYGKDNDDPHVDYSELIEQKTYECRGMKALISKNHYDESTFWSIYNRSNYEMVKQQMDPYNLFRNLFDKITQ